MSEEPELPSDEPLEDPMLESAVFGAEVERFLDEDRIGSMIVARAKEEMEAAQQELVDVDPEDSKAIRAAQFKYQVANRVIGWLRDVIVEGEVARKVVEES